jgi:hypothetical protein
MVGVAPQSPQRSPLFLNRATVGHARSANHAPRAPQVSRNAPQSPANSRKVQQSPAKSRRCPATSRNVPQRLSWSE